MYKKCVGLAAIMTGLLSLESKALPFTDCPSEAFLVQDSVARIYGVNLATGYYQELSSDMATSGKINAVGYNYHDNHIYGWLYEEQTLAQIGRDYQALPLTLNNAPAVNFYVGDVSLENNRYYMYRRGADFGLYQVELDENSSQYLQVQNIIDGASLDLRIYDFAFHPINGFLYSVDNRGILHRIDVSDGSAESLGDVGEAGTFGAVYFDNTGTFYISRNSDGHIFRIDVDGVDISAEFFAFGPSSSNNDGARCAMAPIISENSTVDFGDAPDSYGTSLENNGARHEFNQEISLGETLGGEDDGIDLVTGFESGLDTLVQVNVVGNGYLNAWVDWDQNGSFDGDEQSIVDMALDEGSNRVLIDVPTDAVEGETWARFRYSSTSGIGPTGGVSDGEVEDHQLQVSTNAVSSLAYPDTSSFVTLAYEDNWPVQGDYDMNDVVVNLRTKQFINQNNETVRYQIQGSIQALGASYHNGFAIQLDNIRSDNIDEGTMRFEINGVQQEISALETNADGDDAILIISEDLWQHFNPQVGCEFYRTQLGCEESQNFNFLISVPLISPVSENLAPRAELNPFIFASPGRYHGDGFPEHPGRGLEIHLKNKPVSARFNHSYWQMMDDHSRIDDGITFVTENNMPWAVELPIQWNHPQERVDLIDAYPEFISFVISGGQESTTWYLPNNSVVDQVINNQ